MWSRYFCFSFDCGDFLEQTACVCFDIPEKLHMGTYLAGKTKINWKKNTWKVVNSWWTSTRVPTVYTPVSYLWILGKMCQTFAQHLDIQIEGQFKILSYMFSETISEQGITKWVSLLKKRRAKKISNTQICIAHFATDRPSQFSKARIFPTISSFC